MYCCNRTKLRTRFTDGWGTLETRRAAHLRPLGPHLKSSVTLFDSSATLHFRRRRPWTSGWTHRPRSSTTLTDDDDSEELLMRGFYCSSKEFSLNLDIWTLRSSHPALLLLLSFIITYCIRNIFETKHTNNCMNTKQSEQIIQTIVPLNRFLI